MQHNHGVSFTEIVSPQQVLCEHYLAPKQINTPEYSAVCNYGYHLDAGLFAKFLQKHCVNKLNVKHIIDDLSIRKIEFNPGHRQLFWKNNCIAVGLSAGFIEPLEASALALVEQSAAMIVDSYGDEKLRNSF